MTPQEEIKQKRKFPQEMLLMGDCPNCGEERNRKFVKNINKIIDSTISNYQTNFEQKHIASAVEIAVASERSRLINIAIELLEKEIDDNDDGMWTGREFADKWLAHLTSLKELIK